MEETIQLPTHAPIRADLVQRISRLAGAFVENIGYKGKVRMELASNYSCTDANADRRLKSMLKMLVALPMQNGLPPVLHTKYVSLSRFFFS